MKFGRIPSEAQDFVTNTALGFHLSSELKHHDFVSFFTQVKLLQSLGLKSTLITDGTSPINLFNTAHGLIGALEAPPPSVPSSS